MPVLGDTEALLGHRIMPYVDRVVIAVPQNAQARVRELIEQLRGAAQRGDAVHRPGPGRAAPRRCRGIAEAPLAPVSGAPSDERRALVEARRRTWSSASLALLLGAPLMALIALAIKLDSPGPVFFRQRRHGFNNEEILVWKFRSMRARAADRAARRAAGAASTTTASPASAASSAGPASTSCRSCSTC